MQRKSESELLQETMQAPKSQKITLLFAIAHRGYGVSYLGSRKVSLKHVSLISPADEKWPYTKFY
jgi:hypothetical protein